MKHIQYLVIISIFLSCSSTHKALIKPDYRGNIIEHKILNNENDSLGILSGELIDSTTRELLPAWASLTIQNSRINKIIDADSFGKFHFINLQPGNYSLIISYVGYFPFLIQNIEISRGKNTFYKIALIQKSTLM